MKLTTYNKYKDSGIEWLGDVPEHWEMFSIQNIAEPSNRYSLTGGPFGSDLKSEEYTEDGVRIIQLQNIGVGYFNNKYKIYTTEEKANQLHSCNIFPNDIIVAKMADPVARACLIPDFHEKYLMASDGIRFVPSNSFNRNYLVYAINSKYFRSQAEISSNGITRLRIGLTTFKKLALYAPQKPEQTQIANYLDQATTKIDEKIDLLTQKIKHYQNLKTALINRVVTKGLDDSAEMKDSGVEWIGEIPKHWEVKRLKDFFYLRKDTVGENSDDYTLLSLTQNGVIERDMENLQGKFPASFDTYQIVEEEDLIFCLFDMDVTPRTVGYSNFNGMITGAYTVLKTHKDLVKEYFYWLFLSADEGKKLRRNYTGLRSTIKKDTFLSMSVSFPPQKEQQEIVAYLNQETSTIDKITATIITQIEHQKELRKTLINDVVTGKVKVENN